MIKNYFKIAWRNLTRHKVYAAINIAGLAAGLSACILIFLFIKDELSYDSHFSKSERIYRVACDFNLMGEADKFALVSKLLAPRMKKDFPEVEHAVRLRNVGKQTIWYEDKAFNEENIFFADSNFFQVFNYQFLAGNPNTALMEPKTIVLTEPLAEKFFGTPAEAVGKTLRFSKHSHLVTGVIKDPGHSHIKLNALMAMSTVERDPAAPPSTKDDWFGVSSYTYALLKPGTQPAQLEKSLQNLVQTEIDPWIKESKLQAKVMFFVQPLTDVHLINDFTYDISPSGNRSYLYIFGFVALFILTIACINYMNLATARSARRAKEVGLRKVVGAHRSQLVRQFIGESVFITLISVVLALVLVELILPFFNELTEKSFSYTYFLSGPFLLALLGIMLFVGLVAGSYPAFFLSKFKPVDVLKSDKSPRGSNALLRKVLVVTQFTISLVMIIGTLVVFSQMHYLKNTSLGFNKEQVLVIDIPSGDTALVSRLKEIKSDFLAHPSIKKVATAAHIPGNQVGRRLFFTEHNGERQERTMSVMAIDYDFLDLMDIKLADGRNFSKDFPTDQKNFLVNEAAVRYTGWQKPVGEKLSMGEPEFSEVVGVVKDFHFASLHNKIEPMALVLAPKTQGFLLVRTENQNLPATISFIEEKWKAFDQRHPMEYFFLDVNFDKQYRSEEKMLTVFGYFAGLTIFIACLGLFGLASFTAEQRTKEIGIRKVMGSSVSDIILLLSRDFALLVIIAIVLASPIAWFGMHKWLEDFAYRTDIGWWIFGAAGFSALLIAMLTVSFQATKAALLNPIKALRAE